jgi:hypothetical protein
MLVVEHGGDTMLPRIGARCIVTKSHARRRRSTAQRSFRDLNAGMTEPPLHHLDRQPKPAIGLPVDAP